MGDYIAVNKMKSIKKIFLILVVFPYLHEGRAQLNNSFFYDQAEIAGSDTGRLILDIDILGFLKNNEYTTSIVPGYTLFGSQFLSHLTWTPNENIRIEAGGFLLKDFGNHDFRQIRPVLKFKYSKKSWSFIFGTLEGSLNHRLIEPVFNIERVISHRIEEGIQFKVKNDKIFLDTWLHWLDMIYFGDPEQEKFLAGLSLIYKILEKEKIEIEIPVQLMAWHRGGEIDVNPLPANTLINSVLGLGIIFPLNSGVIRSVRLDNYYTGYSSANLPLNTPYEDGEGWFFNLTGKFKWFEMMLSYWKGEEFYSPVGSPVYLSSAIDYSQSFYHEDKRDLIIARVLYEKTLGEGLSLGFRFEPFYDLRNNEFEHTEALYLRFRTDFSLTRIR